jgi:hypothetical protein
MIPEIEADFRLVGSNIFPDDITRFLGITPSVTWLAGEYVQKTMLRRKEHGWLLKGIGPHQTYEMSDVIFPLLDVLLPKSELIVELCDTYN